MAANAHKIEPEKTIPPNHEPGFWKSIVLHKFSKPQVTIFTLLTSLFLAFGIIKGGVAIGVLLLLAIIGIIIVYGVVAYPKFGIAVLFIAGYLLFIPMKMPINFPLGTLMDALEYLLILGFFIKQKYDTNWKIYKDRLSIIILIWIGYNFLELVNPASVSVLAWVYTIRSTAVIILTYFIFVYQIRDVSFIKFMFKLWLFLAFLGAADGLKQEFIGYFDYERTWLYSDPLRVELLFQFGHMRKFSIFSDPVAFAYNMAAAATLCIALMLGPLQVYKKVILGFLAVFCIAAMLYSGTRGAFPLIPGALLLAAILNYNKKILVMMIIGTILLVSLIYLPTSNQTLYRFQTAFRSSNDASFKLRKANQDRIRPFIQTHPLGGGLGATGTWGQRFAPGSMLANFPPDSGYVRVAVELGSIGIFLLCLMVFTALKTGINNYFIIKDPELKNYCLAMTMVVFVYNIGNYPQEAIAQFPSNVIFFFAIALINITARIDREKNLIAGEHD